MLCASCGCWLQLPNILTCTMLCASCAACSAHSSCFRPEQAHMLVCQDSSLPYSDRQLSVRLSYQKQKKSESLGSVFTIPISD
ncbi:hypothetical protein DPMN_076538 [Dreissena polymorpha]|uniref:Secreted protein n=1 Tax=Dreissena polymorpha TaxID=45954 RepID=A0A9D3YIW9_DREPO|nr:hypothetical protein DPMN_076538 [Dreissena polymorpha]